MEREIASEGLDLESLACSGDAAAFGKLIREYDHELRGTAWSVVRDSHAVDDVMQQSYEKAFKAIKTFSQKSTLKTWLHSICYRTALDHVRYEGRRKHGKVEDMNYAETESDISLEDEVFVKMTLNEVLDQTDPETRTLMMLTSGLGYTYDETAEVTGVERGTIASRIGRARAKLRKGES